MTFDELSEEQRLELKQALLTERLDERGESPSYGELADVDEIISDQDLRERYEDIDFSPDDFLCSAGQADPKDDAPIRVGCKGIFKSPYEQYAEHNGKPFTVLKVIDKDDADHDISEVGKMYKIQFKDKTVIEAWPEELVDIQQKAISR